MLGCWSSITPVAHAATHAAAAPKHAHHATGSQPQAAVTPQPGKHRRHPATIGTGAVNGLGILPFYTYVSQRLTDHTSLSVNVANGNLVIDSHNLSIAGTGLPLSLDTFYNSQASPSGIPPSKWQLSPWQMVTLFVNGDGSVNYTGPSGFTATFTKNGDGTYNDAPGIDATLVHTSLHDTLTFHATGEVYVFSSTGGGLESDKDRNGNQVTRSSGSSLTDTQGRVTTGLSSTGLPSTITDPSGRTVHYSQGTGGLVGITDLAGKTTSFGYTSGSLTSITDPLNQGTTITYNGLNRVASITDATGAKTIFDYDITNMKTTVTDANGHATVYTWDSQGRVIKIVDALNHSRTITYSNDNKPSQTIDALNTQTSYTYDTNTNLTQVKNMGTGETSSWAYTDSNNPFSPTSQTDAQGNHLRYTYSNGTLLSVGVPYLGSTKILYAYQYNSNGTLSKLTDAYGNVTTYGYDAHGNLTSITHPSPLGGESFSYDTVSRVSTSTDGLTQQTTYTYDNLDRVTKLTYAGGISVSYSYDDNGNLSSMTDPTGTTSYTYDKDNRVLTKTLPGGTQLTYTYDPVGNLLTFTDGGGQVSYSYNQVNELVTLTEPGGARTTFGYDAAGQRTSTSYPNGVVMSMSYDTAGHLTLIQAVKGSTTLSKFSYTYGSAGLANGSGDMNLNITTYSYDILNRLSEASVKHGTTQINDFKYQYDWSGNLTSSTLGIGATPTSYTYNAANELTGSTQGSTNLTYSYDANGNLSGWTSGGLSFSYNTLNQTTAISGNNYSYSGSDQTDRVQAGNTSYVSSFNGISSQTDSSGTTYYTRCSCAKGTLVDERTPAGAYYYLFDGLGSIVGLTDSNGTLVSTYQYDPYGNLTSSTGSVTNPWRFAGGYFDSSTGLYKFGTRYYNPGFGRWSQQDPVRGQLNDPTSLNRYVYAGDDPVNFTDPSGMSSDDFCFFLTNAELDDLAFAIIIGGLAVIILSVPVDGTIIGLPAGLALAALGAAEHASGWYYLWYFDKFYPNGAWICIPGSDGHRVIPPPVK